MHISDNTNPTGPAGRTPRVLGLDADGIADESAITDAALLAELSEPDALEELENLSARVGHLSTRFARQEQRLEECALVIRALIGEHRAAREAAGAATFHLAGTPMTVARLEQLLDATPAKAAEVLDALHAAGMIGPDGCLDVRVELHPCEVKR